MTRVAELNTLCYASFKVICYSVCALLGDTFCASAAVSTVPEVVSFGMSMCACVHDRILSLLTHYLINRLWVFHQCTTLMQLGTEINSGGANAVKEPGHFEVRKSSSQVTRMHFFLGRVDDLF